MGDPTQQRQVLLLFDGERALWRAMERMLVRPYVVALDLWHVQTYLWTAAGVFHTPTAGRQAFVTARLRVRLTGKVGALIGGLKQRATKHQLTGEKRRTLAKVIGYLERNRDHMRYDEYLRPGDPIGGGVIEGACRYVIKDPMERTGMNWSLEAGRARCSGCAWCRRTAIGRTFRNIGLRASRPPCTAAPPRTLAGPPEKLQRAGSHTRVIRSGSTRAFVIHLPPQPGLPAPHPGEKRFNSRPVAPTLINIAKSWI